MAKHLQAAFAGRSQVHVVDLGCGTGSNLRATSALLPSQQNWTLVDYDPRLLAAAREALGRWADHSVASGDRLIMHKGAHRLDVGFLRFDLNQDLDTALGGGTDETRDLVTASAFFDLCSPAFMERFAHAVARRRTRFYTVLTYNGEQSWTPSHPGDAEMTAAFHHHQRGDKGFGVAAGPDSARALAGAFRAVGYRVQEGESPWILGVGGHATGDQSLVEELAHGFAAAVEETGLVAPSESAAWRTIRRTGARVGHTDTFAQPA